MMMSCRSVSRLLTNNIVSHSSNYKISRNISKSSWMQARIVELVPALGESITEGSIASWNKNVGDHVAIDDVIVIVETDKVTVDIKSTNAGVLVAKLADDTVVVGAPLYELETSLDAAASIAKPSEHAAAAPATSASAPAHTEEKSHGRIPLIKFIGKRSLVKHNEVATPAVVVAAPAVVVAAPKIVAPAQLIQEFKPVPPARIIKEGNGVDFSTLKRGAMFGRPALSQREMDSIENGGATY